MKIWRSVLLSAALLTGVTPAWAADSAVSADMKVMAKHYRAVLSAENVQVFKEELAAFRESVVKAGTAIPTKLKHEAKDSADVKDYQHGIKLLVEDVDKAAALADEGKLAEAKQLAEKQFANLRDEYHKKYK